MSVKTNRHQQPLPGQRACAQVLWHTPHWPVIFGWLLTDSRRSVFILFWSCLRREVAFSQEGLKMFIRWKTYLPNLPLPKKKQQAVFLWNETSTLVRLSPVYLLSAHVVFFNLVYFFYSWASVFQLKKKCTEQTQTHRQLYVLYALPWSSLLSDSPAVCGLGSKLLSVLRTAPSLSLMPRFTC